MHIEIYTIKGREYQYQVTNYREGDKIKHRKKYLGPVNPINKAQRKKGSGRKPTVFARPLSDVEKNELEKAKRANNAFARDRARIILLSTEGKKSSEICDLLHREKRSILEAIKKFNAGGLAALKKSGKGGRKTKITVQQRADIIQALNTDPRKLGKTFSAWSLSKLRQYAVERGIIEKISIETLRQILINGNKKYKKSRKWLFSNDPNFSKKN
jgi:transposase